MKWRVGLAGFIVAAVAAMGVTMDQVAVETERIAVSEIQSVDEIFDAYEEVQAHLLPVILPDGQPFFQTHHDVLPFASGTIDTSVLVAEEIAPAVMGYRITVSETLKKNGRSVRKAVNAKGDLVAKLRLPRDYSPDWFVKERYPALNMATPEALDLLAHFSPSRISIEFMLIDTSDVAAYAYHKEYDKALAQAATLPVMRTLSAPLSPVFKFSAIAMTTNGLELTMQDCPTTTSNITIAASTDMSSWSPLFTQSVQSGLVFQLAPTNSWRCFAGYDANEDPDGDLVPSGQEILDGTLPDVGRIDGDASYQSDSPNVGQSGPVYIMANATSNAWTTAVDPFCVLDEPGAYELLPSQTNSFWVKAFMDSNTNGVKDALEAYGYATNNAVQFTGTQMSGMDIVMLDPDTEDGIGDTLPDWWEDYWFGTLGRLETDDSDGDKLNNRLEYMTGTNPVDSDPSTMDNDEDGMSNDWEKAFGLNRFNPNDAHEDLDGDGFTNLEEYNGSPSPSAPTDPLSTPTSAYYVATNGSDSAAGTYTAPFQTINKALATASSGSRIVLMPGTYSGSGNVNQSITKDLTLTGIPGEKEATNIDSNDSTRCLRLTTAGTIISIRHLTFTGGTANGDYGGAIFCNGSLTAVLEDCCFRENEGSKYGGAVSVNGATVAISRCSFIDNEADWYGGALHGKSGADLTVSSTLFKNNEGGITGGAVYLHRDIRSRPSLQLIGCSLLANQSDGGTSGYGAIEIDGHNSLGAELQNCILWGNLPTKRRGQLTFNYCCIEDMTPSDTDHIINRDPVFADDGVHLSLESPCLDRGDTNGLSTTMRDLGGHARILGDSVDMGAHELMIFHVDSVGATPQPPYDKWSNASFQLQDVLDFAEDYDIVLATNGNYMAGGRMIEGVYNRVVVTNKVLLLSENGPEFTTIYGAGPRGTEAVRCAYVGDNATVRGFKLFNGNTPDSGTVQDGGGAWIETNGLIDGCIIAECSASNGGGVFGGTLRNSLVVSNTAISGAGICSSIAENCTICDNSIGSGSYDSDLFNCIVYYNTPQNIIGGNASYCCTTPLPSGTGHMDAVPLFENRGNIDYRLLYTSPCIDQGESLDSIENSRDLDMRPRSYLGNPLDIGAYENYLIRPNIKDEYILEISDDGYSHTGENHRHQSDGSTDHTDAYEPLAGQDPMALDLGFTIDFYGTACSALFLNMNGNVSIDNEIGPAWSSNYVNDTPLIAPFWADTDSRTLLPEDLVDSLVTCGKTMINKHPSFVATWPQIGYCDQQDDKTNTFQVVIIDRSDISSGAFDLEFNYLTVEWETGTHHGGGVNGFGGDSACVGWYGGSASNSYWLPGSGTPGSFTDDTGSYPLKYHSFQGGRPGRYLFQFRNGLPLTTP